MLNTANTDFIIVFFGMSVVLGMLGIVVFAMGLAYQRLARKNHDLYIKLTQIDSDIKNQHQETILNAQKQAQEILTEASKKSQMLVSASDIFASEYKEQFRARLLQILAKEEGEFQKVYETVKNQSGQMVTSINKNIQDTLANEMKEMRTAMQNQMKIGLDEYKKNAYARLEEEVSSVVELIAKNVLKKSLNEEEHKRLVIDALKEAKENNVL